MPNTFTQSTLQDLLQEVPSDIKEWIGSEKATNVLGKLNDKLGLKDNRRKIIPRLVLRLETKDLHPAEFIEELSHKLDIGLKSANMIAEEIKEEILKPIEPSLDQWGVNIDLIDTKSADVSVEKSKNKKPKKKEKIDNKDKTKEEKEGKEKSDKNIPINKSPVSKLKTTTESSDFEINSKDKEEDGPEEKTKKERKPDDPFMIHQEKGREKERKRSNKKKKKRKKSFSFSSGGFFSSSSEEGEQDAPKAQIGTPEKSKKEKERGDKKGFFGLKKNKKEKERVVHYSDNRTDLSDDGSNKFINLSNLEPSPKNKKERKRKEKPKTQKKQSENINKSENNNKDKNKSESENDSFLGNINKNKINKKDFKDKKNKSDNENGPQIDGNTVDLSQ